jgi:hypothetical protein
MSSRHLIPRACMSFIRRSSYKRWSSTASAVFILSSSSLSSSVSSVSSFQGSCASYCGTHQNSVLQTRMASSSISSSFTPPEPPASKGTSVFLDIDFSVQGNPSSASFLRNNDQDAVFVVTGANRGIGLQLVKSLTERTKVSERVSERVNVFSSRSPEPWTRRTRIDVPFHHVRFFFFSRAVKSLCRGTSWHAVVLRTRHKTCRNTFHQ